MLGHFWLEGRSPTFQGSFHQHPAKRVGQETHPHRGIADEEPVRARKQEHEKDREEQKKVESVISACLDTWTGITHFLKSEYSVAEREGCDC